MSFLVIATFKSNKVRSEVEEWVNEIAPVAKKSTATICVAPSFPYLANPLISRFADSLRVVAQDVSPFPPGSYTGAVNATQLQDLGVTYCLIGHSERRKYFHESPSDIANKATELVTVGITPVLCLAEEDIFPQFAALDGSIKDKIIYCYEPPANIGGSEAASSEDIKRVVGLIRSASASEVQVMYGGSVNSENVKDLLELDINGLLISSASLDPKSFHTIISKHFS